MADSRRLTIMKALTTLFEGITPAGGFSNDLSTSVYRGRYDFGTEVANETFLSIMESPEQLEPDHVTDARERKVELRIQIWGVTDSYASSKHPSDEAYALLADTIRRLSEVNNPTSANYFLSDLLAAPLRMDTGVVRAPEDGVCRTPFFVANLSLSYVENLQNP